MPRKSRDPKAAITAFLKLAAREHLAERSDHHAAQLAVGYNRLVVRDTRSRWGSCSSSGALMYSWRLIMAPDAVSDYVAAHEVAHLVEMNHSAAFWAVVEGLCPDYRTHRLWLRENGGALHAVRGWHVSERPRPDRVHALSSWLLLPAWRVGGAQVPRRNV